MARSKIFIKHSDGLVKRKSSAFLELKKKYIYRERERERERKRERERERERAPLSNGFNC